MKKIFFSLVVATMLFACKESAKGPNGVTYKNAVEYNDYIVGKQTKVMQNILAFGQIAQSNPDSANKMLDRYAMETEGFIRDIKGMPAYKGDSTLRNAAINTFSFYKKIFENEYKRILKLNENMTEEASTEANGIIESITQDEEKLDKAFHNAQAEFAKKNNIKLIENSMQKKMDELNKD